MQPVYRSQLTKWIAFILFPLLLSFELEASVSPETDVTIHQLYKMINHSPPAKMADRLDTISGAFIGKAYLIGALGEGPDARFDQFPRYRTDAFDCDTYVTTTLALALAKNEQGFKQCMCKVRYKEGKVDFLNRNHFMSLDWNPNNQKQNFIKDITETIRNKNNQPLAQIATAVINKPSWYQHFTQNNIRLNSSNEAKVRQRLTELKQAGTQLRNQNASIPYLPLRALFDKEAIPNQFVFAQIPHGAIIEIVRPNWDLSEQIGTNLNVSHLGFAFWKDKTLLFRQASSQVGKVIETPLIEYLKETLKSPTIKGINIQIVVPQAPLNELCVNPIE